MTSKTGKRVGWRYRLLGVFQRPALHEGGHPTARRGRRDDSVTLSGDTIEYSFPFDISEANFEHLFGSETKF
ncbi:unnamed protein product [Penicillium roqueforti FM164]|uniref:Uncharacterized protein n=1 Tax=Penicillium roqueforti (strain FM164) TaxID=1365484 RepID=W6QLV6_PENRF|nr:unnamed protein product [Penicillium roqueforti FM164]